MIKRRTPIVCLVSTVFLQASLGTTTTASPEERFAETQAQFDTAKEKLAREGAASLEVRRGFREAAEGFAALAHEGVRSANLYINAGNAWHFAGDEPRALLWYLRAARLANTPETRSGLATLRRVCKAELWPPEHASIGRALMFWHYDLGHRLKQVLLLIFYPLGTALVIVGIFARQDPAEGGHKARRSLGRRTWARAGLTLMIMGGAMGISDVVAASMHQDAWAVVLDSTKGYAGDSAAYSVIVDSIVPGQEIRIVESRLGWKYAELPSTIRCWIPASSCEPVRLDP